MVKMIFSDMDGTLLDESSKIPAGFDEMMARLRARGVRFAPASGRQYFSLLESFPAYKDEFYFLAENGTNVVYRGETIYSCPMNRARALEILDRVYAANPEIFCVYCGLHDAYVLRSQHVPKYLGELKKYYTHSAVVERFEDVEDECIKVSLFDEHGRSEASILPLVAQDKKDLKVVLSSDYWVDVMNLAINKGVAVREIQKRLDLAPEECAAFGDYLNDKEMLESVGYSFAMANAHPDIKKVAKYQTASNAEHGVLKGIGWMLSEGIC